MAYSITRQNNTDAYGVYTVEVDTLADKDELPVENWKAGSVAICLENSSVWMLGGDKVWHEL